MPKRKTNMSETAELLRQHTDLRSEWGEGAWKTIKEYIKNKRHAKTSTLKNIVSIAPKRYYYLNEILENVHVVDVAHNATCIGGHNFDKGYKMRIGRKEFFMGKECHDMLSHFGLGEFSKTVKEANRSKKRKELEELIFYISPKLREKLEKAGIDAEQMSMTSELIKDNMPLTEQSLLYSLDTGRKRSFLNWFREGIKNETITNKGIIYIYDKLQSAAHLVSKEELAKLTVYSYEWRQFKTKSIMGSVIDDLNYLSKNGKITLDEYCEMPAARYRKSEDFEKTTIKDRISQPDKTFMTFFEAFAIKLHFRKDQDIEKTRIETNREVTYRYGTGQEWHYILKDARSVIEEERERRANDYKKFGKLLSKCLPNEEYNPGKEFLERSGVKGRTERENYLRLFPIEKFRNIAPVIVSLRRKRRFAEKKYRQTRDELLKRAILKEECLPKEDLLSYFEKSGIEGDADKVIDMIVNASFVRNKNFLNFQKKHGELIGAMYDYGIIEKRYLPVLKTYYDILQKESVKELNEETIKNLEMITQYIQLPFVEKRYRREFSDIGLNKIKYLPERKINAINIFGSLLSETGFDKADLKEFENNVKMLKNVVYIDEGMGNKLLSAKTYSPEEMRKKEGSISVYDVRKVKEAANNIKKGFECDKDFLKKLKMLYEEDWYSLIGLDQGSDSSLSLVGNRSIRFYISSESLKNKIEKHYEGLKKDKDSIKTYKR